MKFLLFTLCCITATLYAADVPGNDYVFSALSGIDTSGAPGKNRKDSLKYFPSLLNNKMRVQFDPNKYILPDYSLSVDTVLTQEQKAAIDKLAKSSPAQRNTATKDELAMNKKSSNTVTAATVITKESATIKKEPAQKDTMQAVAKAVNKTPVVMQNSNAGAPTDTSAATLPVPVKESEPAAITHRSTNLVNTYRVNSPHITVQLFDDGQIDGDAVSVYYNGKLIINNQTLTHKAITFDFEASAANRHHEFVLIAESEGFVSPNTALMRIKAGNQQFELNVSSSTDRNAKIAVDYTGE